SGRGEAGPPGGPPRPARLVLLEAALLAAQAAAASPFLGEARGRVVESAAAVAEVGHRRAIPATRGERRPLAALAGLAHAERASAHLDSFELTDRTLCFFLGGHLHETEAARAASGAIHHHGRGLDGPGAGEDLAELVVVGAEGEVSDEQPLAHCRSVFLSGAAFRAGCLLSFPPDGPRRHQRPVGTVPPPRPTRH